MAPKNPWTGVRAPLAMAGASAPRAQHAPPNPADVAGTGQQHDHQCRRPRFVQIVELAPCVLVT